MSRSIPFDPDAPALSALREVVTALPGSEEQIGHGRPVFRVGTARKVFGIFGAEEWLVPRERLLHPTALLVKVDPVELDARGAG